MRRTKNFFFPQKTPTAKKKKKEGGVVVHLTDWHIPHMTIYTAGYQSNHFLSYVKDTLNQLWCFNPIIVQCFLYRILMKSKFIVLHIYYIYNTQNKWIKWISSFILLQLTNETLFDSNLI